MIYKEIEDKSDSIKYKMGRLEEEINQLKPQVLQHFNKYLDRAINKKIPNGYKLLPSEVCFYEKNGFNILIDPHLQLPSGELFKGPFEFERIIMDLRDKYVEETPWISHINITFSISK